MKARSKKESAACRALAEELASLIPDLDEEGLSFLIEQARVHLYNMEILRQEAEALSSAAGQPKPAGNGRKGPASPGARKASGSAVSPAAVSPANFRIERSGSGSSYHLISGGKWKMYNEGEMLRMVKIASGPGSAREAAVRLHAWLTEERPDTFADLELGDARDPRMDELVLFLRSKFAIRGK